MFFKKKTSSALHIPPGFAALSLDSERAISGEPFGIAMDTSLQQVTISVKSSEILEVAKVVDLAHEIGHDQVRYIVITLSSLYDDVVAVTLGDQQSQRSRRGAHTDDLRGDAALTMTSIIKEGQAMGIDFHPMTDQDITQRSAMSWSDTEHFPPQAQAISVSGRSMNVDGRVTSAFEIDVDETLAFDAVIDAVDALRCDADVSLVFRPALNGSGGRFAAALVVYGNSETEVEEQVASIFQVCSPEHRLRIRRCFYGQDLLRMLSSCSGITPWQQMSLKIGQFHAC